MPRKTRQPPKRQWQDVAQEAQQHRDATINQIQPSLPIPLSPLRENVMHIPSQLLEAEENHITTLPPQELLSRTTSGNLSATAVVNAHLRRAGLAQNLTNCITELLPSRASDRAQELDAYLGTNRKPVGPLHGLPISVKEHIGVKTLRLHAGYIALWDNPSTKEDALVIQILERAGAVIHARTTEPQSMMQLETDSNLYGATVNPRNRDLSAGGSSGGEGALIALGGSCLGIGTDVGGSIRVPAAACGIYGFKPTAFRIPTTGWSSTPPGADPITTVIGPLSSCLGGIDIFMKTIIDSKPWLVEPALLPLPWTPMILSPSSETPLRIGIMQHDDVVLPHPPITRALQELVNHIESSPTLSVKAKFIEFPPYKHDEAWAITSSLYFTDGGASDASIIEQSGEPWRPLADWIIRQNPCVKDLSREELEYWLEEREEFRLEYARHWNGVFATDGRDHEKGAVDVLICPVAPWIATPHGTAKYWSYTSLFNLLDYPALAFPSPLGTTADRNLDTKPARSAKDFMSDIDKEIWTLYDPSVFHRMPVSLQIVGRRGDDERVLGVARWLKENLRKGMDINMED